MNEELEKALNVTFLTDDEQAKLRQALNILAKKEVDISILFMSKNYDMYNNLIYSQHCHILNILGMAYEAISHRYLTYDEFILLKMEFTLLKIELQGV